VTQAVKLAAQRHFGGLLPGGMRLIEQAMLLRRYPVGARLRELVAIIAVLLPDALQRLGGRMPAQNVLEQAMQQQQAPATQTELAPESPDNVPARSNLQRSRAITATTNRPRLSVASAMPARIDLSLVANPFGLPQLVQSKRYLSLPYLSAKWGSVRFARTDPDWNPVVLNADLETVNQTIDNASQYSCLGTSWTKHLKPVLGADGKALPVYQLKPHQFELCKELLDEVPPGYCATGAMMQFDNDRAHIAVRLQCQESLDCEIIAATSGDRAATWNRVILRDEKGGPAHLIYPVSPSKTSGLETGSPLTQQP
jgi:hypothetical protein